MISLIFIAALLSALLIDAKLGEPAARWHPVVWMGNYLSWAGKRVAPVAPTAAGTASSVPDFKSFGLGGLAWCAGAATVWIAAWGLQTAVLHLPQVFPHALGAWPGGLLAAVFLGLLLKPLLAWAMLKREVLAVEAALGESLVAGRQRLAWLVSRDVAALTEAQVRESAIESLAENLNDSVVAPVFWFVLLGLPGAALYRFANTADAMWGYRGERHGRVWEWAGKWAARADDALSWLPARLTAWLIWTVTRCVGRSEMRPVTWWDVRAQAALTPSPNSGWPMGAMALGLGVRLAKPGVYALNPAGSMPARSDTDLALIYCFKSILWFTLIGFLALLLVAK